MSKQIENVEENLRVAKELADAASRNLGEASRKLALKGRTARLYSVLGHLTLAKAYAEQSKERTEQIETELKAIPNLITDDDHDSH